MRRPGQYGDSGGNAYANAQMQHMPGQRLDSKSGHYQGRQDPLSSDKEQLYGASKSEGQWRFDRDQPKASNMMSPHMYNEGQGGDASRSYYQGQRSEPRMTSEKRNSIDPRSERRGEDIEIRYEDNLLPQTFEGIEQKFLDDIMKLSKEHTEAEDAENTRHRERINAINSQYQEQLGGLRVRHANRRDEVLRRESQARQQQYQQTMRDQQHPSSGMGPSESHGYGAGGSAAAAGDPNRGYTAEQYDSYRERARFLGGPRDQDFEPRGGPYPGGRVYDTGSRYY